MARKSRKSQCFHEKTDRETGHYTACGYVRLSDKDGEEGESNSIQWQKKMILDYVRQHEEITLWKFYVDDGKTGVNFQRRGFKQMMEDIRNRKADCIIVKDLSRFARNYLDAGIYLEKIFPLENIRFIAITDHFDSTEKGGWDAGYLIPLKNILNEKYSADISLKIQTGKRLKAQKGEYGGSLPAYGYQKNGSGLEIDPYAGKIVRLIVWLFLEKGWNISAICRYLEAQNIRPPAGYFYDRGFLHTEKAKNAVRWSKTSVKRILTSEVMTGNLVQHKITSETLRGKRQILRPQEEWIVSKRTHPPLISGEEHRKICEILAVGCPDEERIKKREKGI